MQSASGETEAASGDVAWHHTRILAMRPWPKTALLIASKILSRHHATALDELLSQTRPGRAEHGQRVEFALQQQGWFDRKAYMQACAGISAATASRDLRQMVQDGTLETSGSGRMTKYRKKGQRET